jgi:mannose-6-phosphate isomerase
LSRAFPKNVRASATFRPPASGAASLPATSAERAIFSTAHLPVKHIVAGFYTRCILGRMRFEERPWGSFTVLDEAEGYKVKRVEVLPRKRLSYQKHTRRSEHWMVVQGIAKVTLDGAEISLATGEVIDVPIGAAHRIENPGSEKLIFIEIQRGAYLGEDDILRLQDDYGRQV